MKPKRKRRIGYTQHDDQFVYYTKALNAKMPKASLAFQQTVMKPGTYTARIKSVKVKGKRVIIMVDRVKKKAKVAK